MNKDLLEVKKLAEAQGWTVDTTARHIKWIRPDGEIIVTGNDSKARSLTNDLVRLRGAGLITNRAEYKRSQPDKAGGTVNRNPVQKPPDRERIDCPLCDKWVWISDADQMRSHLLSAHDIGTCEYCNAQVPTNAMEDHLHRCMKNPANRSGRNNKTDKIMPNSLLRQNLGKIEDVLKQSFPKIVHVGQVAFRIGLDRDNTSRILQVACGEGKAHRIKPGWYASDPVDPDLAVKATLPFSVRPGQARTVDQVLARAVMVSQPRRHVLEALIAAGGFIERPSGKGSGKGRGNTSASSILYDLMLARGYTGNQTALPALVADMARDKQIAVDKVAPTAKSMLRIRLLDPLPGVTVWKAPDQRSKSADSSAGTTPPLIRDHQPDATPRPHAIASGHKDDFNPDPCLGKCGNPVGADRGTSGYCQACADKGEPIVEAMEDIARPRVTTMAGDRPEIEAAPLPAAGADISDDDLWALLELVLDGPVTLNRQTMSLVNEWMETTRRLLALKGGG